MLELTARERSGIIEVLAILESLLRDVLLCCEAVDEEIVIRMQQVLTVWHLKLLQGV